MGWAEYAAKMGTIDYYGIRVLHCTLYALHNAQLWTIQHCWNYKKTCTVLISTVFLAGHAAIFPSYFTECLLGQGHNTLTSCELMWYYACCWDVRGDLTLNSMAQVHTCHSANVTWSHVELWSVHCQHVSHISVVAHISWDVRYVKNALQTLLKVVSRNWGNAYWKKTSSLNRADCSNELTW
jgi:hypothetical protein